jgi:DNA-directed RNA polymerase specialized sigma24 family protein
MEDVQEAATYEEVVEALRALTEADHAKLMMIAASFCLSRRFSSSVLEPGDLLSQAVMKTLQMAKKWSNRVSIVRHLDRAMENISGHLARQRSKIVPFPDGLTPSPNQKPEGFTTETANSILMEKEQTEELLADLFGTDDEARKIFVRRAEGVSVPAILTTLGLTQSQYETIARRIRRSIATHLKQIKPT